jgi:hypothetical protein
MFYEYDTIKCLIFWQAPESIRLIWAEHLRKVLTKINKDAPNGWLRNLLNPIGSKMGITLTPSENDMILHLNNILKLPSGKTLNVQIAKMWGVNERTIRRLVSKSISNNLLNESMKDSTRSMVSENLKSPQHTKKRKEEQRTPSIAEKGNLKQSATFEMPQSINDLKSYTNKVAGLAVQSMEGTVPGNIKLIEGVPVLLAIKAHKATAQKFGFENTISKLMVDQETQTSKESQAKSHVKKKHRKKTILNINKPETTIKILVQKRWNLHSNLFVILMNWMKELF